MFDLRKVVDARVSENEPAPTLRNGASIVEVCRRAVGEEPIRIEALSAGSNDCHSYRIRTSGRSLKCFECASTTRAHAVRDASEILLEQGVSIPRVVGVVDHVVFAEWIPGTPMGGGKSALERMAAYQAQIHRARVEPGKGATRIVHLDWLLDRLRAASDGHAPSGLVDSVTGLILDLIPPSLETRVVQPDFIKANIIETKGGDLVLVDNEFLGIGPGFEFDILNASHVVSGGDDRSRRKYLNSYAAAGGDATNNGTLETHAEFWDICYLLKFAGKRFATGDFAMGSVCLELLDGKAKAYASRCRGDR